jgi:hypothetical protein
MSEEIGVSAMVANFVLLIYVDVLVTFGAIGGALMGDTFSQQNIFEITVG